MDSGHAVTMMRAAPGRQTLDLRQPGHVFTARHRNIREHRVDGFLAQQREGFLSIVSEQDSIPLSLQASPEGRRDMTFVVDNQYRGLAQEPAPSVQFASRVLIWLRA